MFVMQKLFLLLQVTVCTFSRHDTLQSILHVLTHTTLSSPSLYEAIYNLWIAADIPLRAMPHLGYSFLASLQQYGSGDALIGLTHDVWLGRVSMHALARMGELLRGLSSILESLSKVKVEDSPCAGLLPKADVVQMLRKLCPSKTEESIESLAASLSWHEEGSFVRVGEIKCCGAHCTQITDTAALCSETSLNSPPPERAQLHSAGEAEQEVGAAGDQSADVQDEVSRQASVPLDPPDSAKTTESLEQEEKVHDRESTTGDAMDSHHSNSATPNSEQAPHGAASDVPPDAQVTTGSGDHEIPKHSLPVLLLQQHAEDFERLRTSTWDAVCACDQDHWPGGNSLAEIHSVLEGIEGIDSSVIPGCVDAWSRLPCPCTRESAANGLLVGAPLQHKQDFDLAAASAWVDGLQGRGDGCGSAAMLPDVA